MLFPFPLVAQNYSHSHRNSMGMGIAIPMHTSIFHPAPMQTPMSPHSRKPIYTVTLAGVKMSTHLEVANSLDCTHVRHTLEYWTAFPIGTHNCLVHCSYRLLRTPPVVTNPTAGRNNSRRQAVGSNNPLRPSHVCQLAPPT